MAKVKNSAEILQNSLDPVAAVNESELARDFAEIKSFLKFCASETKNVVLEFPNDNAVAWEVDNCRVIFLGEKSFLEKTQFEAFCSGLSIPGTMLCCVGEKLELSALSTDNLNFSTKIEQLELPITYAALRSVTSIFNRRLQFQNQIEQHQDYLNLNAESIKQVMSISRELNGERDIPKLLSLILQKVREVCSADAGSIYTLESEHKQEPFLKFRLSQNHSIEQNLTEFRLPVSKKSIVGHAVLNSATINIPDLYELQLDAHSNPYGVIHDRSWDQRIGYESHSMLTLPIYDISHNVIGVIQLINRKKHFSTQLSSPETFKAEVIAFTNEDQEYAEIVAQQAGIALENAAMNEEIENLFNGFVNASVKAIEQRDPTTSGHSHRVSRLTLGLSDVVDRSVSGPFKSIYFSDDQRKEISYAALLHDFGKISVREAVLVKAKKLYPWQYENLQERFETIRCSIEIEHLRRTIEFLKSPQNFPSGFSLEMIEMERSKKMMEVDNYAQFIDLANEPTVLEHKGFEKLTDIATCFYSTTRGAKRNFLKPDELRCLSIARGSLTPEEFGEIQSHVVHTYEFLKTIPWGRKLANVPEYAAKHHEKLDGTGYPAHAVDIQIPIQSRMMAIADIYDALTAADRPYKKAVPVLKALDIIKVDVTAGKLDSDLFALFVEAKVYDMV